LQTISLQGYYPLSLALAYLSSSEGERLSISWRGAHFSAVIILAIGGTDRNVHIWTRSDGPVGLHISLTLHRDSSVFFSLFAQSLCRDMKTGYVHWRSEPSPHQMILSCSLQARRMELFDFGMWNPSLRCRPNHKPIQESREMNSVTIFWMHSKHR